MEYRINLQKLKVPEISPPILVKLEGRKEGIGCIEAKFRNQILVGIATCICFESEIEKKGHGKKLKMKIWTSERSNWKALAEIYTMHSFAPFFNLKISAKNRQHFFAIE